MTTGSLPMIGYPHTGNRRYMANEQLPWSAHFSRQETPGLAWRTRPRQSKKIIPRYPASTPPLSVPRRCLPKVHFTYIFRPVLTLEILTWQKIYVENVPAVFAGNGFSPLHSRRDDKGRAVRHVEKNFIGDNVNNGTARTRHISRTTIWLIKSRRLINRNNRLIQLLISRHNRTIRQSLLYLNQIG